MSHPNFLVASPRSGTKILRDTLDRHPDIVTTDHPLEEIWTIGQDNVEHEAYRPDMLTPDIKNRIREAFRHKIDENTVFLEKNVRLSLRVSYVHEIFPEATFVHIIRDPRDVVVSLRERWKNPIDWSYYLSWESLALSPRDIVYYSARLGWKFIKRLLTGSSHVDVWGPHYPGLIQDLEDHSLLEVCALQWKHCVSRILEQGKGNKSTYFELHYETLMQSPGTVLEPLQEFLGVEPNETLLTFAENRYRGDSIGRWRERLSNREIRDVESLLAESMKDLDYQPEITTT